MEVLALRFLTSQLLLATVLLLWAWTDLKVLQSSFQPDRHRGTNLISAISKLSDPLEGRSQYLFIPFLRYRAHIPSHHCPSTLQDLTSLPLQLFLLFKFHANVHPLQKWDQLISLMFARYVVFHCKSDIDFQSKWLPAYLLGKTLTSWRLQLL